MYSGLRIGELCSLQWNDINLKKSIISINKTVQRIYVKDFKESKSKIIITTPKTKNANREIPVSKEFIELLKKLGK